MHSDARDLREDLQYMRKGEGFKPERIANAGTLTLVLGGPEEPFDILRERFISAIHSLRDPGPALLLAAYALTDDTAQMSTVRQRREHVGARIGRKVDAVTDHENASLLHLAGQLLTGWYPASPLGRRVPELHNGVVQESVSVLTVVNDGHWQETREHYRFFAAFDEVDYLTISTSYPGRPIPEGDFTVRTERIGDSFSHQFWHSTPMRRGQTYDLRYRLVPYTEVDTPGRITEISRAFHERTLTAAFEVVFIGLKPAKIWRFDRLTFFERPGDMAGGSVLDCSEHSAVRAGFRDLYGGLFSGIAWQW